MSKTLTHGSLFAGIGGFELAARESGIKTLWNCEIEPYPRLVLAARFPDVKQYGDICKVNGAEVAPVDIITFGSPCQSFSVAGAREGLDGASGLFYEAVRIIREMRAATNNRFPRYAIMENVPGIYSSKSAGKSDFREVLNELLKIADETVNVPLPKCNKGKFLTAGAVMGDGYSLAWRTLCASKFGVAQRRRRMFLVLDFAGERAVSILSEPQGEGRNFTASYSEGQDSAGTAPLGIGGVTCFEPGALARLDKRAWEEKAQTLRAHMGDNSLTVAIDRVIIENHANDSRYRECRDVAPTVNARAGLGGGNVDLCVEIKPIVLNERAHAAPLTENCTGSLTATDYKGSPCVFEPACYQKTVGALCSLDYKGIRNQDIDQDKAIIETFGNNSHGRWNTEPATLKAAGGDYPGGENMVVENRYDVRRLTPLECLRLQGYPDYWLENFHIAEPSEADIEFWFDAWEDHRITVGKSKKPKSVNQIVKWLKNPYGDSNAYKALGNSLAVPVAIFVMRGLSNLHNSE
jgi:DNA (cytosine-5)-methyltransferase 1